MLCDKCNKADATIHFTEIIKDLKSEIHICEQCARNMGLNSKLSDFSETVTEIISFIDINETDDANSIITCNTCGSSIIDYKKTGKLGCPDCYRYLDDTLRPVIFGYHGNKKYAGKVPKNIMPVQEHSTVTEEPERKIQSFTDTDLQLELELAVSEERYEDAALIRDEINKK